MLLQVFFRDNWTNERHWVQCVLMESSHIDPSDMMLSLARLQWGCSHCSLSSLVPITRGSSHLIFNPQLPSSLYSAPVLKITPIWAVSQRLYQSHDQQDKNWAALWLIATVIQGQRAHGSKSHQSLKGLWEMVISVRWPAGCVIAFEECVG